MYRYLVGLFITPLFLQAAAGTPARLPLRFEPAAHSRFIARTAGGAVILERGGAAAWIAGAPGRASSAGLKLLGASPAVGGGGELPAATRVNYLLGGDTSSWRRGVPTYGRVRYRDIYPGIDLVYYGTDGSLEYDFLVGSGSDPASIRMAIEGTASISEDGSLTVRSGQAELRWRKPVAYQERNGARVEVSAAFRVRGSEVSFGLGAYDRSAPLVIDPVLALASYWGGSETDEANAVAVDANGNIYMAGYTYSSDFPVPEGGAHDPGAHYDVFVTKLTPGARDVVYATVIGGRNDDTARAIAVGPDGSVYLTGETSSADFPIARAFQSFYAGGVDSYVLKLDPLGKDIVYSTFLGGRSQDIGRGIALDRNGNVWVAGSTKSSDFVLQNALQRDGAGEDGFVTKLDSNGSLLWSTVLGGRLADAIYALTVDSNGDGYVVGETTSDDFPVTSTAFGKTRPGRQSGFISKIDAAGRNLIYSTYLGGSRIGGVNSNAETTILAVAVDGSGSAYVTGSTTASDFPLVPAAPLQNKKSVGSPNIMACFVAKLNPAGAALMYSTYLGGTGNDQGNAIAVDSSGSAVVAGQTSSSDFNLTNAFMSERLDSGQRAYDGFVARIDSAGTALVWSSLLGGERDDEARGVALDPAGRAVVVGSTASAYFPRTALAFGRSLAKRSTSSLAPWVAVIEEASRPCEITVNGTSTTAGRQGGVYGFRVVASEGSCQWTAKASAEWIHLDGPVSGSGTGSVAFQVDYNSGAPRMGFVQVGDAVYTVTQSADGCFYRVYPDRMQVASAGGAVAASISVIGDGCPWSVSGLPGWLKLQSPASGTANSSLLVAAEANPDDAARSAILYVGGRLFTVTQSGKAQLSVNAVVETVGSQPLITPGGFLSLFGENLATEGARGIDAATNGAYPISLAGARVRVNGKDAYLAFVAEGGKQINALAPWSALDGLVPVQLITPTDSFRTWVQGAAYAPALYSFVLAERTYALATQDGVIVARPNEIADTVTRCAKAGSTITLYASGLGPVSGTPPEGAALPGTYPLVDSSVLKVNIGGAAASVTSAVLASAGTYQITVTVPDGLTGDVPVSVEVGGARTPGVYLLSLE